jgi:hypothetical protein
MMRAEWVGDRFLTLALCGVMHVTSVGKGLCESASSYAQQMAVPEQIVKVLVSGFRRPCMY